MYAENAETQESLRCMQEILYISFFEPGYLNRVKFEPVLTAENST